MWNWDLIWRLPLLFVLFLLVGGFFGFVSSVPDEPDHDKAPHARTRAVPYPERAISYRQFAAVDTDTMTRRSLKKKFGPPSSIRRRPPERCLRWHDVHHKRGFFEFCFIHGDEFSQISWGGKNGR